MLKLLLKKQLLEIFRSYYYDAKKNKARSKAATIAYIAMFAVLMVVVLGGIFTLLSVKRCAPMAQAGMGLAVFCADGTSGGVPRRVRQRVQYLCQPVSGEG